MPEATSRPGCAQESVEEVLCIFLCIRQLLGTIPTLLNLTFLELFSHFEVRNNIYKLQHAVSDLQNLVLGGGDTLESGKLASKIRTSL